MAHIELLDITDQEKERLAKNYSLFKEKKQLYVRAVPGNIILPKAYEMCRDQIYNMNIRPSDIFVITWPKNGTTWTQELAWCVLNDFDLKKANQVYLNKRSPFIDMAYLPYYIDMDSEVLLEEQRNYLGWIESLESPRIIKSHLPFDLLPSGLIENNKVLLCLRNPKDTVVSYFYHEKLIKLHGYEGDFKTYFNLFMDDLLVYSSYWKFTLEAWKQRHRSNVCLLFYEDMKGDLAACIRKVSEFLGKNIGSDQLANLVEHLSFKNMRSNEAVNKEELRNTEFTGPAGNFIRKGKIGDWKNHFTDEMNDRMNKAIEEHFKDSGLSFIYE